MIRKSGYRFSEKIMRIKDGPASGKRGFAPKTNGRDRPGHGEEVHARMSLRHDIDLYRCDPRACHAERPRRSGRHVDDAAADERPAIVDPDDDRAAGPRIRDPHARAKR